MLIVVEHADRVTIGDDVPNDMISNFNNSDIMIESGLWFW